MVYIPWFKILNYILKFGDNLLSFRILGKFTEFVLLIKEIKNINLWEIQKSLNKLSKKNEKCVCKNQCVPILILSIANARITLRMLGLPVFAK